MMDEGEKKSLKCKYCEKCFTLPSYRSKHINRVHKKTAKGLDILNKDPLICELCGKQFIYKSSLKRHEKTAHSPSCLRNESFLCDQCSYLTFRKDSFKKHIQLRHSSNKAPKVRSFRCSHCPSAFTRKQNLYRHERISHNIFTYIPDILKKTNRQCPLCEFSSSDPRKKEINDHFKNIHGFNMDWHKIEFQNKKEFNEWKNDIEVTNNVFFVKAHFLSRRSVHYLCHRSGKFKPGGTNKRKLKTAGSCKINAHCPCEIVTKTLQDGRISVNYLPTHVGHRNDLAHRRLKKEDRRDVTEKFLSKLPHDETVKRIVTSVSNTELKHIHLLNNKALDNIEKSFNMDEEIEQHPYDPVSVEAWVHEMITSDETSQLFYKPQGQWDSQFPNLKEEDFVLIFMTAAQKSRLQQFGKEIIYVDGTKDVNQYNFQLYTILTFDESRQGFPCAFMFSNRTDITVMSQFFQSIKDDVGQISSSVFMSDQEDIFYSAWTDIMGPTNLRLFSPWKVLRAWQSNLYKVKSKEKKESVYNTLKTLMYEQHPPTFHELLNATLLQLDSDVETKEFSKYFQKRYVDEDVFKNWAYCYRTHSKINTNISLDNFNRVLKFCCLGVKKRRLDKTLCAVLNFFKSTLFDYMIKLEKGKLVSKLLILRERHKTAIVTYTDKDVLPIGDNSWRVISSNGLDVHTVTKVRRCKTCQLQCLHCESCFHEYVCSCVDNSIKTNMCKHIHAVARMIQHDAAINPASDDDFNVHETLHSSPENPGGGIEEKKEKILETLKMIMEKATTEEQIDFVYTEIKNIYEAIVTTC